MDKQDIIIRGVTLGLQIIGIGFQIALLVMLCAK